MNKMGHVAKLLEINFCLLPITRAAQQMCRCADVLMCTRDQEKQNARLKY